MDLFVNLTIETRAFLQSRAAGYVVLCVRDASRKDEPECSKLRLLTVKSSGNSVSHSYVPTKGDGREVSSVFSGITGISPPHETVAFVVFSVTGATKEK